MYVQTAKEKINTKKNFNIQKTPDINRYDVRINYKKPYPDNIIQMNKRDFLNCCNKSGIIMFVEPKNRVTSDSMILPDDMILRILKTKCFGNVDRLALLIRLLIKELPQGEIDDNNFDSIQGVYNIIKNHDLGVDQDELFAKIENPPAYSETDEEGNIVEEEEEEANDEEINNADENALTPFHSETEDEMPPVYTVTSTRDPNNGQKRSVFKKHPSTNSLYDTMLTTQALVSDAKAIHKAAGGRSEITIVCAQFKTNEGKYLKVCFSNAAMPSVAARETAQNMGYVSSHGIISHAEFNMLLYGKKHESNLAFVNHGCNRATCPMCARLMRSQLGDNVDVGPERENETFSRRYRTAGSAAIAPNIFQSYKDEIEQYYDALGNRLPK